MTVRAAWLQSTGQTREDTRLTLAALLTPSGQSPDETPLRSRAGIVPGGFALTGSAPMQATIGTGRAIVQGDDTAQGAYLVAVTAPESFTLTDGNPQYDRIDLIELAVLDDTYDRSGATQAVVRLVEGTPEATPAVPPSGPGSTIPLYTIRVPKGTSAGTGGVLWSTAVTTQHWPAVALGGIMPASGFKGAYAGQYRDTAGLLQRWDGTNWVSYPKAVGGIAPSSTSAGSYTGQYRDNGGGLQRWNGSAWQYVQGASTVLFSATQWLTAQAQSVAPNTWTVLSLPTVEVDDAAAWTTNTTYVAPRTGWWRISAHATWANDSQTGMRGARVVVGGVGQSRLTWLTPAGNGAISVGGGGVIRLVAGETLQLAGFHNHTAAIKTLGGSGYACSLTAEWVKS
ncbi:MULTISPECIES: hypothetical protein [Streptomyces]|uniref:hypothetical protein n=1 Tax=Streptomyces TaxID=1883 RepID=UPI00093EE9FD|nr:MULTISPECIES: hypothetical protein [Streptomyces]MBX9423499.1 hypothetical protein [Streptomyces lateritius]OKJ68128.1 hypothetical protein AMK29_08835 [Streptomyces sp. CB02261]